MDSLTHIVLGATLGEAMAGTRLKKRAMLLGAVAQSLPDIDVVASLWSDPASDLLIHRGFTHSILCSLLVALVLAWISDKGLKQNDFLFRNWYSFFATQLLTHIFLDSFNAYGTGWFVPFSPARISFNVLFVADPLFTIWLVISTIVLLTLSSLNPQRKRWVFLGLGISGLYLVSAILIKIIIDRQVESEFKSQAIVADNYITTPTPFNSLLWYIIVPDSGGYRTSYRSILDVRPAMNLQYFRKNESLITLAPDQKEVQNLIRFSKGYFVMQKTGDTLVFNDLRFGQMGGWSDPTAGFVFHYYLGMPRENKLVLQRGRFSRLDSYTMKSFLRRILGN